MVGFLGPQGNFLDTSKTNFLQGPPSTQGSALLGHPLNRTERKQTAAHLISQKSFQRDSLVVESSDPGGLSLPVNTFSSSEDPLKTMRGQNTTQEVVTANQLLVTGLDNDMPVMTALFPSGPEILVEKVGNTQSHEPLPFAEYFQEGYCKVSELDDCRGLPDVATDMDSNSSHCEREKSEDDDQDDMLGGVFNFCDEGDDQSSISCYFLIK